jgi:oligopeptide/dipeptide ABC transporter ATP-binding protein
MYLGEIVELADADALYTAPAHPYTQALLSAVPEIDDGSAPRRERIVLTGDVPSPIHKPTGCPFHPRCPYAQDKCRVERPAPVEITPGRVVTCHFPLVETVATGT